MANKGPEDAEWNGDNHSNRGSAKWGIGMSTSPEIIARPSAAQGAGPREEQISHAIVQADLRRGPPEGTDKELRHPRRLGIAV